MNDENLGGTPAEQQCGHDDFESAWTTFSQRLANYLAEMSVGDTLLVEVPHDEMGGLSPYAKFTMPPTGRIHAEISGDAHLEPGYECSAAGVATMQALGWLGNGDDGEHWFRDLTPAGATEVARTVVVALRDCLAVAHPQLLAYQTAGIGAARAEDLGLTLSGEVIAEASYETNIRLAYQPTDRDHLMALVSLALKDKYVVESSLDDDGDFVIDGPGQPIWVRVHADVPAVQIMAVPTFDVRSRQATARELNILNRDSVFARWALRERVVWQSIVIPGAPFAPAQLHEMIDCFIHVLVTSRGDLSFRVGGKVAE